MKYGPQTEKIERLLTQLRSLTPAQTRALEDVEHAPYVLWRAAQDAAQDAAWDAACIIVPEGVRGVPRDAILALLFEDQISSEHFDTLYGPWKSVME